MSEVMAPTAKTCESCGEGLAGGDCFPGGKGEGGGCDKWWLAETCDFCARCDIHGGDCAGEEEDGWCENWL